MVGKPNTTKPSEACCAQVACGMQAESAPSQQLAHVDTSTAESRQIQSCVETKMRQRQDSSVESKRTHNLIGRFRTSEDFIAPAQ